MVDRLDRKIRGAVVDLPEPETRWAEDADSPAPFGLVTLGGCRSAVLEALDELREEGIEVDYLRVRSFPFHDSVNTFLRAHDRNFVVEQNRDGQLRSLLVLETETPKSTLSSILSYGGMPLSAHVVVDGVREALGMGQLRPAARRDAAASTARGAAARTFERRASR